MDLVTIACERDIQDLLLQAHSIDKFIDKPCRHWITVEDESLTPEEWHGLLAPYYTRHKLFLTLSKRPDLHFDEPFTLGYRRQQTLKLLSVSGITSEVCVVLDCKNIFVKPFTLSHWPYRNGKGKYTTLDEEADTFFPRQWIDCIHRKTGLPIPSKFPPRLATPFACMPKYAKRATDHPLFEELFFHTDECIPMTEMFYYYFFVPEEELDQFDVDVGGALRYDNEIENISLDTGYTHGLHRKARNNMTQEAKDNYSNWLISLGLNKTLVENYVYYEMTDQTWGE